MRARHYYFLLENGLIQPPELTLNGQEASERGKSSEDRLHDLFSQEELFPWILSVEKTPKHFPNYDLAIEVDPDHSLTKIIKPPGYLLPVDAKSSQIGVYEYWLDKREKHDPEYWLSQWWMVINAGKHLDDDKILAQFVYWLIILSKRSQEPPKWQCVLDQLHPTLVDAFKSHLDTTTAVSLPIIQYLSGIKYQN